MLIITMYDHINWRETVQTKYSTRRKYTTQKHTNMDVCGYGYEDTCNTYENYQKFYNPASQTQPAGGLLHPSTSKTSPITSTKTFSFATANEDNKPANLKTLKNVTPKRFEPLQNGNSKLTVSEYKSLVVSKFNGYVYVHFWGPKGKHISFNTDELSTLFACRDMIEKQIKIMKDN